MADEPRYKRYGLSFDYESLPVAQWTDEQMDEYQRKVAQMAADGHPDVQVQEVVGGQAQVGKEFSVKES